MIMSRAKFFFIGHVHFFFVKCFFMSLAHFWCLHSAIWGIMLLEISISSKERRYFLCGVKNKKTTLTQTTDILRLVENLTEKQQNGKVLFGSLIT